MGGMILDDATMHGCGVFVSGPIRMAGRSTFG